MPITPPSVPPGSPDEREMLLGFARWKREQVVAAAVGLSEDQLRWTPEGRLLPIIGIINHLAKMEWRWIEGRYVGSEFPAREDEWNIGSDRTGDEVIEAYRRQGERTERIIRAAPSLDEPCLGEEQGRGAAHTLLGFAEPLTLRWVLLHLIDETAHHAGHADSTREMLDGTKMTA